MKYIRKIGGLKVKKHFSLGFLSLFLLFSLSGCGSIGSKTASLTVIYHVAALISLCLLIGCIVLVKKKKGWFILLFSSVLVVNLGYSFLSVAPNLNLALWANRLSYLGSVFLPFSMLIIIMNVTNAKYKKGLPIVLFLLSIVVFFIAGSPGILNIYYRNVSFEVVNGVSTLVKEYGVLHPIYLFYLVGYFVAMVTIIVRAKVKKTIDATSHAIILATAVLVNIGVWLIEQLVSIDFEFLSVSYIISELFLLGVHLVMNENQRLKETLQQVEAVKKYSKDEDTTDNIPSINIPSAKIEAFVLGLEKLTPTEKAIYDCYIKRLTTKEVLSALNIKENTLKYHNRNIYNKLGVSSKNEIIEIQKQIKTIKNNIKQAEQ